MITSAASLCFVWERKLSPDHMTESLCIPLLKLYHMPTLKCRRKLRNLSTFSFQVGFGVGVGRFNLQACATKAAQRLDRTTHRKVHQFHCWFFICPITMKRNCLISMTLFKRYHRAAITDPGRIHNVNVVLWIFHCSLLFWPPMAQNWHISALGTYLINERINSPIKYVTWWNY